MEGQNKSKINEYLTFSNIYKMFDPDTGRIKELLTTTDPRGSHANTVLMPDATVLIMGGNRYDAVPQGDPDLGVNTARIYRPPYLFNEDGSAARQPVIVDAPNTIFYGTIFNVRMSKEEALEAEKVVIIRTGVNTHGLYTDIRYVQIPFSMESNGNLKVKAPNMPVQAIPGDYMLFVVSDKGVQSVAKHMRLVFE